MVKGLLINVGDMIRELKIPHATEQLSPCAATTEPNVPQLRPDRDK